MNAIWDFKRSASEETDLLVKWLGNESADHARWVIIMHLVSQIKVSMTTQELLVLEVEGLSKFFAKDTLK